MAIHIALAGNPNCGKTTMFNALTGANQYVGNWPGVTVEKKTGKLKESKTGEEVNITDLPGIYSLSPYTLEEVVSRDFILNEKPDVIIDLVDATNIERNLYLTTQLLETGIPVVLALNMADLMRKNDIRIDVEALSKKLGCPIVETSALRKTGLKEVVEEAVGAAKKAQEPELRPIFDNWVESRVEQIESELPAGVPEGEKGGMPSSCWNRIVKFWNSLGWQPETGILNMPVNLKKNMTMTLNPSSRIRDTSIFRS